MRIGVNCFLLQANTGGMKQYFFNLFRELLQHHPENEYVFFYFPHNIQELAELYECEWQRHAVLLDSQEEIRNYLKKIDLYFHPFGTLWPRPVPIPSVVTLVDIQEVFYPQFFTDFDLYNREYHFQGSTHSADRVITISHFSKQTIVEHHRISPEKVIVAHLCADKRFYRAAEVAVAPPCSLPPVNDYIVYPANHWFHKNHNNLLLALKWLKDERNLSINAVFTGYDIPGGYQIGEKSVEYGLGEQVFVTGYVSVPELAYLYQHARAMVFPSLFEGFGIPLVEAMAVGCPVLAARVTSLPEIGREAVAYFEPDSPESIGLAIEKVWQDATLRQRLVEQGQKRALEFSAAKLAQIHLAVFTEAAEAFSPLQYAWNKLVYEPFHHWTIHHKYRRVLQQQG
jgi:glycosyltransferase involved in cell wall biosynthesis